MATLIRLNAALDWIDTSDKLADIGCDHGYLAIEALKKGIKFVQLIDNKEGPLNVAKKNLNDSDYKDKVEFTLASGLVELRDDINCVAILGMGGELICDILEEGKDKLSNLSKIILEPNTKSRVLRQYLFDNCFKIISEKIVKENDKFYELILCEKSDKISKYDQLDILFGPVLRKEKSPIFIEYWTYLYNKYKKIISSSINPPKKLIEEVRNIEEIL